MSNKAVITAALGLLLGWPLAQAHADGPNRLRTAFTGPGKCLDIINDGQNTMADCGNFTGQMWTLRPTPNRGVFRLLTEFTGPDRCLGIINDGQNNKPSMKECGDYTGQMWQMSTY
jgi:hypothetical protein